MRFSVLRCHTRAACYPSPSPAPAPQVFGAGCLVLPSMSCTADAAFSSISVSAECWLPLEEVPPGAALAAFLARKAAEGYTLVGLEQTADSERLQVRCACGPCMHTCGWVGGCR